VHHYLTLTFLAQMQSQPISFLLLAAQVSLEPIRGGSTTLKFVHCRDQSTCPSAPTARQVYSQRRAGQALSAYLEVSKRYDNTLIKLIYPELRNESYANLSLHVAPRRYTSVPVVHRTSLQNQGQPVPLWRKQWRHDLGLTQCCLQLRAEYMPIYLQYTAIYIALLKFIDYAKTIDDTNPPVPPSGVVAVGFNPVIKKKHMVSQNDWNYRRLATSQPEYQQEPSVLSVLPLSRCFQDRTELSFCLYLGDNVLEILAEMDTDGRSQ
jgi:hypothetical protein